MEIVFLGTGGTRFNLIRQYRWTGGFLIKGSYNILVDPGPGSLVRSLALGEDFRELDIIIATHAHVDHITDLMVSIEAMTNGTLKKRGIVFASQAVYDWLSSYHKSLTTVKVVKPGDRIEYKDLILNSYKILHKEPTGFGFKLEIDNKIISHTSDTWFYPELKDNYKDSDLLIANTPVIKEKDSWKNHLSIESLASILPEMNIKKLILTHFSTKILDEKEVIDYLKPYHSNVIAAKDGMRVVI